MKHVCEQCKSKVAELKAENKRLKGLESVLKVVYTWARYDFKEGEQIALVPLHVINLCNKHHLIR